MRGGRRETHKPSKNDLVSLLRSWLDRHRALDASTLPREQLVVIGQLAERTARTVHHYQPKNRGTS